MKVRRAKSSFIILMLAAFGLLCLSGCGVFEVGIENTPTPPATASPVPTNTAPAPTPTQTPFPGKLKPGQSLKIIQIRMLSATDGWAIGDVETDLNDHVLYTRDGGQTWQERTPPEALLNFPPEGLAATAYFGANGTAWVTYVSQKALQSLPSASRTNTQQVWRTSDSGQTWEASNLDLSGLEAEFFIPANLGFLDEQHGWMMAHLGVGMSHDNIAIFTSADGGQTWQRVVDPQKNPELMACPKTGLAFSTPTNGWLTGNCPGLLPNLFFYNSLDGGKTWQQTYILPPANQPEGFFSNGMASCGIPNLIYASARTILVNTRCTFSATNKTVAWLYAGKDNRLPEARYVPTPYGSFYFINADEGWMVGAWRDDPTAGGEIYHSIDGGRSWKLVISTAWQGMPDFIDTNTGWVVARIADKSALVYTVDAGKTWKELTPLVAQ